MFEIAGNAYHNEIRDACIGDVLMLVRDRDNPVDGFAMQIHHPSDGMLGFVPRRLSRTISALFDHGYSLRARLTGAGALPEVTISMAAVTKMALGAQE